MGKIVYEAAFVNIDSHSMIGIFDSLPKAIRRSLLSALRPGTLDGREYIHINEVYLNKKCRVLKSNTVFSCPPLFKASEEWMRCKDDKNWYRYNKLRVLAVLPLMKYLKRGV